jgi:hypothetical protein
MSAHRCHILRAHEARPEAEQLTWTFGEITLLEAQYAYLATEHDAPEVRTKRFATARAAAALQSVAKPDGRTLVRKMPVAVMDRIAWFWRLPVTWQLELEHIANEGADLDPEEE